ncbi:hypothetical protein C9374_002624 [Naegleria lovaniensis]|uniref:Uncharacterized protein n=1 Tax=Naegleria lovaniensis TaxID=51637 RepID=A0AA88GTU9_NAELO|nr:uncharacterized protein C9374_002624 [Naegleria lovaniensis]KAG2386178.1 hypothetical protein C9374_002624 [Naegleria lovaniensis]
MSLSTQSGPFREESPPQNNNYPASDGEPCRSITDNLSNSNDHDSLLMVDRGRKIPLCEVAQKFATVAKDFHNAFETRKFAPSRLTEFPLSNTARVLERLDNLLQQGREQSKEISSINDRLDMKEKEISSLKEEVISPRRSLNSHRRKFSSQGRSLNSNRKSRQI